MTDKEAISRLRILKFDTHGSARMAIETAIEALLFKINSEETSKCQSANIAQIKSYTEKP